MFRINYHRFQKVNDYFAEKLTERTNSIRNKTDAVESRHLGLSIGNVYSSLFKKGNHFGRE